MQILVVHPAQQHSYHLAVALYQAGYLDHYVTTVYYQPRSLTAFVAKLLRGNLRTKAMMRRCPALPDALVLRMCEGKGLLKLLTMHLPLLQRYYRRVKYHTADRFAEKVADYIALHPVDAVVCYDDCSSVLFPALAQRSPHVLRIMDVSAANVLYMRKIYEQDMRMMPEFAARLRKERTIVWDQDTIRRTETELCFAQMYLVPSEFVSRSLRFSGIPAEKIHLCPYGADVDVFSQKMYPDYRALDRPLRFIYVGGVKELKGIGYLLHSFQSIPRDRAELIVVGACDRTAEDILPYLDCITFTGPVLHSEMPALLAEADVFVFPSLGDSYALVVMEAAACGLPVIVSKNTGAGELITDGVEGFVIPIQSEQALTEKVLYFVDHPDQIEKMGRAARKMAEHNRWEDYYTRVCTIFGSIINNEGDSAWRQHHTGDR